MITYFSLIIVLIFFAMNMGASGIAPSFAAAYGSKKIHRGSAVILFSIFVVIGAVLLGRNVSITLGKGLLPKEFLNFDTAFVILTSATLSLFIANIAKIPQSTSQVTVGAIMGVGLYYQHVFWKTFLLKIVPVWIGLPLLSFGLTYILCRKIYPPRHGNLRLYEKLFIHEKKLRRILYGVSCYVAFAIGSNNVANAVGPLHGAGLIAVLPGLLSIAPIFGIGAWTLGKGTLETAGKEIVPLGVISGTIVSVVTATLLIIASVLGVPQSLVQLNVLSLLAVSSLKNGHKQTFEFHLTKKTFFVWIITPVASVIFSYVFMWLKNKYF